MPGQREYGPPYPFHCQVSGMPLMLETGPGGEPAWSEEKIRYFDPSVNLTAEDRNYQQFPPEVEFPYAVTELWGGMGMAEQRPGQRTRYSHALFADCSGGRPIKGPRMNAHTAMAAAGTHAADFNGITYIAAGRYLYKRVDDTAGGLVQVRDFGAGVTLGKLAAFQGTQTSPFLFIPIGAADEYWVMSTAEVFTQHPSQEAEGFEAVRHELWLWVTEADGRRAIRKATDGGAAATWGAATYLGDAPGAINWLVSVADRLLGIKTDGLYAPSAADVAVDEELKQELRPLAAADNGKGAIAWDDNLIFPFGRNLYRFDPTTGQLQQFGPELLEQNASEVRGELRALGAQAGLCLWAGLYNAALGHSYLLRFGAWRLFETASGPQRVFVPAWHGALFKWASKQLTCFHVTTTVGGIPRLYCFFSDGTAQWCKLSRTQSALDDPNYEYDTANTGYVYYPRYTANFPFERKLIKAVGLGGRELLSGTRTIGAEWKYAQDSAYTAVGSTGTDPGERLTLPAQPAGQAFDFAVTLVTGSAASTPVLNAFVVYASLRTENLKRIRARVQARDDVVDLRGRPLRQSWRDIRAHVENALSADGAITVINPAGETITVIGINYGHAFVGREQEGSAPIWSETLDMIQTKSQAVRGTWDRAAAFTWAALAAFTWEEVRSL